MDALLIIEGCLAIAEIVLGFMSGPNRRERRIARSSGAPIPRRDVWAISFVVVFFVMLIVGVLAGYVWYRAFRM